VIFAVRERPVQGTRGTYRVNLRHGVSRIRSGERFTLGVIFHDPACAPFPIEKQANRRAAGIAGETPKGSSARRMSVRAKSSPLNRALSPVALASA